jgi:hypothetical protein
MKFLLIVLAKTQLGITCHPSDRPEPITHTINEREADVASAPVKNYRFALSPIPSRRAFRRDTARPQFSPLPVADESRRFCLNSRVDAAGYSGRNRMGQAQLHTRLRIESVASGIKLAQLSHATPASGGLLSTQRCWPRGDDLSISRLGLASSNR